MAQFKLNGRKAIITHNFNSLPKIKVMEFRDPRCDHKRKYSKPQEKRKTPISSLLFCIKCGRRTKHYRIGTLRKCTKCNERYFKGIKSRATA